MPVRNRLPRETSLKSRNEIDLAFRQGKRFSGSCFGGIYLPDNEFKYAILVSKRLGSAPERNRIKRVFREAIRLGGRQTIGSGKLLILPRPEAKTIGPEPIRQSLIRACERIRQDRKGPQEPEKG